MARTQSKILTAEQKRNTIKALREETATIRTEIRALKADRVVANKAVRETTKKLKLTDKFLAREQKELDKVLAKIAAAKAP